MADVFPEQPTSVLVFANGSGEPIAVPSDVVTAGERAYRCHLMRVGGNSWEEIATAELYPSGSAAKYDVDRYIEEGKALVVESSQRQMLTLEVARLDRLQHSVWAAAMGGHVPSVSVAMSIIMNRAKLVGLDAEKMNVDALARTVVVPSSSDGYIAALKSAAGVVTQLSDSDDESENQQGDHHE
jgi:hypothetical protein